VIDVVVDTEGLPNHFADAGTRPQVRRETRRSSSLQQELLEPTAGLGIQLRRTPWRRTQCDTVRAIAIVSCSPPSNGSPINTNVASDLNRRPALGEKIDRFVATTFESFRVAGRTHCLASARRIGH